MSNQNKKTVGIIGGAGYTGGELIRLLIHHPAVDLAFVHSRSQVNKPVHAVHPDLIGETDLIFTDQVETAVDILFLCMGHGQSAPYMESAAVSPETLVIDLSRDYRLDDSWVYGLPEIHAKETQSSTRIANPGCFATAIQLGLLPLAKANLLHGEIHVHAITGSTGAGQKPISTTHFSWRNNNLSIYKAFKHQHLDEINQSLEELQGSEVADIAFLPLRGDFPRGIFASLYLKSDLSEAEALALYQSFYQDAAFTTVTKEDVHLKQVVNTNKALIKIEKIDGRLLITSMIDNLLKGASGQAVQNMNIALGLDETTGLKLKALAF